jgi:hypothetical protein
MEPPDLESRLPELLRRTVSHVPLDTNLEQRMRHIMQHESASPRRRLHLAPAIMVALIAVLTVAGFVWLRPTAGSTIASHHQATLASTVPPTSTAAPTSTPVSATAATDRGITIVIDSAYADASQTMVFYHFASTVYQLSQYSSGVIGSQVRDSEGHVYDPMAGAGGVQQSESNYTPLLPSLLMRPQSLTLVVNQVDLTPLIAVGGVNDIGLTGLWQVPFVVTPIVPNLRTFHVAPITHAGVTVQPVSLEVFSGQHPFETNSNQGAGARLILRISGLLTPGALQSAAFFDSSNVTGESTGGAHLTFDAIVPSDTAPLPGSAQGDTEEVEILYWVPLQFNESTATLTINRIRIGLPPNMYATGPWSFDLAIG